MKKHLSTTSEVVARLNKDWDGDVRAFDDVYEHILQMADALAPYHPQAVCTLIDRIICRWV
jgi:hypothetical protein